MIDGGAWRYRLAQARFVVAGGPVVEHVELTARVVLLLQQVGVDQVGVGGVESSWVTSGVKPDGCLVPCAIIYVIVASL